ncbi:hypothetical protein KCP76_11170 [Salmonella enterica subsp. enterica serovar Weltevreden]|nr:hypothetical protein KCP76_11170 [Salmonella enterica subsp. enterica serovar Weltevreden]
MLVFDARCDGARIKASSRFCAVTGIQFTSAPLPEGGLSCRVLEFFHKKRS